MKTVLFIGGDLCTRTARLLDPYQWKCIGLRRRAVLPDTDCPITWHQADLQDPESLSFLGDSAFSDITHILYAPAPSARTEADYSAVYARGLPSLLKSLPAGTLNKLQRCVLVTSSAVWAPTDDWVNETTQVDPTNFRARAMLAAEDALHASLPQHVAVTLRLSGLYGPDRVFLVNGLKAGRIKAPDGPGHWGNRIHIDDAASACRHLLELATPLTLYIGTDDHPVALGDFYEALAKVVGAPAPAREMRPPGGKRLSNARLRASGWVPEWPRALDWYARYHSSHKDAGER